MGPMFLILYINHKPHIIIQTPTPPLPPPSSPSPPPFPSPRIDKAADPEKRAFTYFMLSGARFMYASTARVLLIKFVSSMSASADVLALASAEFELGAIEPGTTVTVKWRGKPIFIRNRTDDEIAEAQAVGMGELRDQETDAVRVQKDNWLVVLGEC